MPLIVQKFGGTSVADTQKILGAAQKAIRAAQAGHQVECREVASASPPVFFRQNSGRIRRRFTFNLP